MKIENFTNWVQNEILTLPKDAAKTLIHLIESTVYQIFEKSTYLTQNIQKRQYYRAQVITADMKIESIWLQREFGKSLVVPTLNIGNRQVLKSQDDLNQSKKIVDDLKKEGAPSLGSIAIEKDPEGTITDGICFGYCLDVAKRVIDGEPIESIVSAQRKGGSAEAAASQAVYQLLTHTIAYDELFLDLVQQLKHSGDYETVDFDALLYALTPTLKELRLGQTARNLESKNRYRRGSDNLLPTRYLPLYIPTLEKNEAITPQEMAVFSAMKELAKGIETKILNQEKSPEKKESTDSLWSALIQYAKKYFKHPKAAQPTLSVFDGIEDPLIKHQWQESFKTMSNQKKKGVVARYNGLQLRDMSKVFGPPGTHPNDQEFLALISNLGDGIYEFDLHLEKSGHAILLKIEGDKRVILDPNIGLLKADNTREFLGLLTKILDKSPPPKNEHPHAKKGDVNHRLKIFKIEKNIAP